MQQIATSELLDLKDPPTCILYPDDFSALGGINEIHERGLRIPDDISIAGYDGLTFARILGATADNSVSGHRNDWTACRTEAD